MSAQHFASPPRDPAAEADLAISRTVKGEREVPGESARARS